MMEMMALMQGNYGAIQGLSTRMKSVLIKNMSGGIDSDENRRALAAREG
jgi:hypothetical protein